MRSLARALVLAAAGLLAGATATMGWYWRAPAFVLNLERDLPPNLIGVYPVERAAGVPFAWTSARVALALPGADRRLPWQCTIRARGARPVAVAPAELTIAVDGVSLVHRTLANDVPEDVTVTIPPQPAGDGLTITLAVAPPFQPGASDRRQLGMEITGFACRPEGAARAPARAWAAGGAVTAVLAGALGLAGVPIAAAIAIVLTLGIAAGLVLASGAGPYSAFPAAALGVGGWTAVVLVAATAAARIVGRPLSTAARVAVALSATLFTIEALALLHPSKTLVDALFHAHRLEWVIEGRLLFTQPMPSGVRFPYAIALYIVAAPWTLVATNHVALLKIVVLASRALAGLVLYPVVTRAWKDRAAGLVAIVLVHAVPLPFVVIGNANLTYAFGQSVAVMTIAAAVIVGLGATGWRGALLLWALASLAFLSHVGLFPVLGALLVAAAAGYAVFGRSGLGRAAAIVAAATLLAAVFSVVVYYGHFGEAYRTLRQVRATPAAQTPAAGTAAPPAPRGAAYTLGERAESAGRLAVRSFGWPVIALAVAGLVVCVRAGWRDPLGIAIAATLGAAAVFETGSVLAPVAPSFWRYAAEFISRVNYAAVPAVVILAGRAASAGWTRGGLARIAAGALLALAVAQGTAQWLDWLY